MDGQKDRPAHPSPSLGPVEKEYAAAARAGNGGTLAPAGFRGIEPAEPLAGNSIRDSYY